MSLLDKTSTQKFNTPITDNDNFTIKFSVGEKYKSVTAEHTSFEQLKSTLSNSICTEQKSSARWVTGILKDSSVLERKKNIKSTQLLCIDGDSSIDQCKCTLDICKCIKYAPNFKNTLKVFREIFTNTNYFAYTSHSNTKETPRWRIIIPLSRIIYESELDALYNYVLQQLNNNNINLEYASECTSISQIWFTPSYSESNAGDFYSENVIDAEFFDVNEYLKKCDSDLLIKSKSKTKAKSKTQTNSRSKEFQYEFNLDETLSSRANSGALKYIKDEYQCECISEYLIHTTHYESSGLKLKPVASNNVPGIQQTDSAHCVSSHTQSDLLVQFTNSQRYDLVEALVYFDKAFQCSDLIEVQKAFAFYNESSFHEFAHPLQSDFWAKDKSTRCKSFASAKQKITQSRNSWSEKFIEASIAANTIKPSDIEIHAADLFETKSGPTPAFPLDTLPREIRDIVSCVSKKARSEPEVALMCLMPALSAVVQRFASSYRYDPDQEYNMRDHVTIWTIVIANSGAKKTSVANLVNAPLKEWDKEQAIKNKKATANYLSNVDLYERKLKIINRKLEREFNDDNADPKIEIELQKQKQELEQSKPIQSLKPQLMLPANGSARGKIQKYLEYPVRLDSQSEAGNVVGSHAVQNDPAAYFPFLNSSWSAESGVLKNSTLNENAIDSENEIATALCWQMQENVFEELRAIRRQGYLEDIGFFARCAICKPATDFSKRYWGEYKGIDNKQNHEKRSEVEMNEYSNCIFEMLNKPLTHNSDGTFVGYQFKPTHEAGQLMHNFYNEIIRETENVDNDTMLGYKMKLLDKCARIACIFHVYCEFKRGNGDKIEQTHIDCNSMQAAIDWIRWEDSCAQQLLGTGIDSINDEVEYISDKLWRACMTNKSAADGVINKSVLMKRRCDKHNGTRASSKLRMQALDEIIKIGAAKWDGDNFIFNPLSRALKTEEKKVKKHPWHKV